MHECHSSSLASELFVTPELLADEQRHENDGDMMSERHNLQEKVKEYKVFNSDSDLHSRQVY